ncbi:YheC/YheD family protein [Kerstersia gyiorum]|uniref:YheC/YheD family protein n=1 Tax=Kerstersia gyiorum TaxID=206506 RepID=UPI000838D3AA|nr:YheC/YheD family protein [Kerstersia gyiorum]MCR4158859.1 YheC/YheD family protein [Kerstersia gyiorum]
MSIETLLAAARPRLSNLLATLPARPGPSAMPACVLFFSVCNGQERATVHTATGADVAQAWEAGAAWLAEWEPQQVLPSVWLRVDAVHEVEQLSWLQLKQVLGLTKRNYFRYGLAWSADFSQALLEQELAGNAILYDGTHGVATPNARNLAHYSRRRFGQPLNWPDNDTTVIWRFKTLAVFTDGAQTHEIEKNGRNSGYRVVEDWGPARVSQTVAAASQYLAEQVQGSGQYHYGWFPCFDRAIPTYNALRHASSTYALLEGWEITQDAAQFQAIERALAYLTQTLIKPVRLPGGKRAAFLVDQGNEIKLGGNAVCLLALAKYTELSGDGRYLPLLDQLATGILHMQHPDTGAFSHVLNYPELSLKAEHRIIYYDGEAAFGLMRLYGLTQDARWLQAVERAFEHFIAARHWQAHDHWLSYCVNELTRYRPDPRYYQFGLDNVRDYLGFVRDRITTFPTLLELMMAAQAMIERIQADEQMRGLLEGFPLSEFYEALEARARHLLNGFFWPELAMFFRNPERILNGFFIRHHSFRVRIDDVEHYLSGYVAYLRYRQRHAAPVPMPGRQAEQAATQEKSVAQPAAEHGDSPYFNGLPVIGVLSYPARPDGFREVQALARAAWKKKAAVFYLSYRDQALVDGEATGFVFDGGGWRRQRRTLPAVIDNAPPNTRRQMALAEQLAQHSKLLCHRLGGKGVTLDLLARHKQASKLLIPSAPLALEALQDMLRQFGAVVVKPYRSNRGRNVFRLSVHDAGAYLLEEDQGRQLLDDAGLAAFCAGKAAALWMVQRYIDSRSAEGKPFDIRVPIFRAKQGAWKVARKYVRIGAGNLTSNLATGGVAADADEFLAQHYGKAAGSSIARRLSLAARRIADALQEHYDFSIDALGCDFGVQDGEIFLFEVNSYPGMKGCLDTAVAAKTDYYIHQLELLGLAGQPVPEIRIAAATPENQALLQKVMAGGQNDFSASPYLRKGIGNPVYRMLGSEARKHGCSVRLRNNTCLEVRDAAGWVAVFSPNSPDLSLATRRIANNKVLSKLFLQRAGIAVPSGRAFASFEQALEAFRTRRCPQVVKPRVGSGGKGVTAGIDDEALFAQAWQRAQRLSAEVIVEDFVEGDEVRVFVLDGKVTAAVCRVPAYVVGDGQHSVAELVTRKNEDRARNPLLRRYPISNFDYLQQVLKKDQTFIPGRGEYVRLAQVSNVALGGESVGVLKFLHPSIRKMAERVWQAVPHATQLGLDIMARDFQAPAQGNAYVIEFNADPAVATPAFAAYGEAAPQLPGRLMEYVLARRKASGQKAPAPVLAPAPAYVLPCAGRSFASNSLLIQMRLLRQAAYARNLDVFAVDRALTILDDGQARVAFLQGMCGLTRLATPQATTNKQWTKQLLEEAGVRTPAGRSFALDQQEEAWAYVAAQGGTFVLKPLAGSGGAGVTTDVREREHFDAAWQIIAQLNARTVICEEQIPGKDYRLIVIGDGLCAVTQRVPAYVVGDGRHDISGLIAVKNRQRAANPYLGSKPIELTGMMLRNLALAGLTPASVLPEGQHLQLHAVANIGSGGESHDVTEHVHPEWASVAVQARRALYDAVHVGLDLLAEDISLPPSAQKWAVIEVNSNPEFGLQHFVQHGQARDVAGMLIDHVFPGAGRARAVTKRMTLTGAVQDVGLRRWIWGQAHLHGVSGWVRNGADGAVEALFHGAPRAVAQLMDKCRDNAPRARVANCVVEDCAAPGADAQGRFVIAATVAEALG